MLLLSSQRHSSYRRLATLIIRNSISPESRAFTGPSIRNSSNRFNLRNLFLPLRTLHSLKCHATAAARPTSPASSSVGLRTSLWATAPAHIASFVRQAHTGASAASSKSPSPPSPSSPPPAKPKFLSMDAQFDSRSKRKHPSTTASSDRPKKQFRADKEMSPPSLVTNRSDLSMASSQTNGEMNGDANGSTGHELEEIKSLSRAHTAAETAEWQETIEAVVKKVVSIHFCAPCAFDTESAIASEATGFVVDAERGYILTNRHVVGAGPFWGHCIFDNHEEVDVYPVYRDPVHDFGILKFDPAAVKYLPLKSTPLRPDLAKVGVEIRVVGNDAGEKLSILSGVISRLDRNAPDYGDGYCDFNTNYIQAAASASGGSSGSPVVNIDGYAIALQAGGRADGAATDYFLPLDRPLRALRCIQNNEAISRGTIQTQWVIKPFDECKRLGLTSNWEDEIRKNFPKETGMLVAEVVLPQGPADEKLQEGDILIKVNDELLTQFIRLDDILDSSVGGSIKILVSRGGEDVEVELKVGDLHAITPDRFVTVAGASFHDLSYQQARLFAISTKDNGVFVAEAGGSFRFDGSESGWLVISVDNKQTPDLDTFVKVMAEIPDRSRVVVAYKHLRDLHTLNTAIINVDRHWSSKMTLAVRNDNTGLWDFTELAKALPPKALKPQRATFITVPSQKYAKAANIIRSFVRVTANMPVKLDGFPRGRKTGHGVVIDAEKGLVIISRAIVPYDLCDITVTIADSIIVDGEVVFMHPLQNYAIIKYDPALVQAPVETAKLSSEYVKQGDDTIFFGFNHNYRPVIAKTTITDITTVAIPASATTPRYRAINLDAVTVDTGLAIQCGSGVLIGEDGTVQALWMTYLGERSSSSGKDVEYHLGFATPMVLPIVEQIRQGIKPELRIMSIELSTVQMSQARIMGVAEEWIERVEREDAERHQLFMVRKIDSGYDGNLKESDIILSLDGKLITRVNDLDIQYHKPELDAVVMRRSKQLEIKVPTVPTADLETTRAVIFCGAVLHRPHHAVRQQISKVHSDVYISARQRGSPAYSYGLSPTNFITHVNGAPTPDLDTFLVEVKKVADNTYFRLKVMTFDNIPWVATMKKCEHYFPTIEFVKDSAEQLGWKKIVHEAERKGVSEILVEGGVDQAAPETGVSDEVPEALELST